MTERRRQRLERRRDKLLAELEYADKYRRHMLRYGIKEQGNDWRLSRKFRLGKIEWELKECE